MAIEEREQLEGDGAAEADDDAAPGKLRSPLLEDGQPAYHWWLVLPGIACALLWAAYHAVTAEGDAGGTLLTELLWPGPAILVAATLAAYLGWRLDLD